MGPQGHDVAEMTDDRGVRHKVQWRVPQIREWYFRKGSDRVAQLTTKCATPRFVVVSNTTDAVGKAGVTVRVVDGARKVVSLRADWGDD